ncbi:helicase associated domain-containing protein [Streptomyces sp. NPDC048279]|uniref:helicase associated domain-containing protein n=1 Tax=Streptomyces sp. NPDC048279 TaxID=3154714 RepID=UPI003426A977
MAELRALGVVWPVHDTAWEEGLIVARAYAAASGWMPLPPTSAVWKGCPIGTWVENQRPATRKARENTERRTAGETVFYAGELPQDRLVALDAIDPGWCPSCDIGRQRCFCASPMPT